MKNYQVVFNRNQKLLSELKDLQNEKEKLGKEINENFSFKVMNEYAKLADNESLIFSLLGQEIEEEYYETPFKKTRDQGKKAFWNLVDQYLEN